MYKGYGDFTIVGDLVTDGWTFETAFFDFNDLFYTLPPNKDVTTITSPAPSKFLYNAAADLPADTSTTGVLSIGGTADSDFNSNTDEDWFAVTVTAGQV